MAKNPKKPPKKPAKKKAKKKGKVEEVKVPRPLQLSKVENPELKDLEDVTPIVEFLEMFRELSDPRAQLPMKLISIKMPIPLLQAFKFKSQMAGVPYQTMIKRLMKEWLSRHSDRM